MSHLLDSALDADRREQCLAHDVALAQAMSPALERPKLRPYLVKIGRRGEPRVEFGVVARSSAEAVMEHLDMACEGERVEAIAVRSEPFPLAAKRHELAEASLREVRP